MKQFWKTLLALAVALVAVGALAQADPAELAARQANPGNAFWNPTAANLQAWNVVDGVEPGATVTWWTMSLSPTFNPYLEQIIANFQATYPGVTVRWEDVPWDGLQARVRNSFTAGNPPDVANISPAWIGEFASAGLLLSTDDLIRNYPQIRGNYVETAWNTNRIDGKSYLVPWYLGLSNFVAYNQALLAECGMTAADLPRTWVELRDFARQTLDTCGYYATSLNFGPATEQYLVNYLAYNDVPVFNADGTVALNTPEAAEALQVWVDLIQEDLIPRSSLTDDHRNMIDRFSEGETVLIMVAPHMLRIVNDNNPAVFAQLGVAGGITGSSGASSVDVQALVIPKATATPNAALALALFITNPETQAEFSKWAGIFPSNLRSYADPYFTSTEGGQLPMIRPLAFDYVFNADNRSVAFPRDTEVQQIVTEATQAALLGQMSPQAALDQMSQRINALLGY
jgi:putative chitobiose transport system substrate-binding protein